MTPKRLFSLISFAVLVAILLGGGIYMRNVILREVNKRIQSYVSYSRIHLHVFPPAIVLDDIRTVSPSPFLSAKQVVVELPIDSLFKSDKPLVIFIDQPVIRVTSGTEEPGRKSGSRKSFSLPFALAKVRVKGGQFYYAGKKVSYQATGFRAILEKKGDVYSLRADLEKGSVLLEPGRKPFEGEVSLFFESQGDQVQVKRFDVSGPEIVVKAKGSLTSLTNPEGKLRVSFKGDMDAIAGILKIPFSWAGRTEGEGELTRVQKEINYQTSFNSDNLVLSTVPLEKVRGQVEFSPKRGVKLDMTILKKLALPEFVKITYGSGVGKGELQGFHLDPILSQVSLPWPVLSPVWGNFVIDDNQLVADIEFRDDAFAVISDKYPFRGPVHFTWDKKKLVTFSSPRLETSFGEMELNGKVVVDRSLDISIKGKVSDVKSSREFTSLVLQQKIDIPEIRGGGKADVLISDDIHSPKARINFDLAPAGFDQFDVSAAEGRVDIANKTVQGEFQLNDPLLKGEIHLFSEKDNLNAKIRLAKGSIEKILTGLDIKLPLTGMASGDFEATEKGDNLGVTGTFSSPLMKFVGADMKDVVGKLSWDGSGELFSFPDLAFAFYGGSVKGTSWLNFKSREMGMDLAAEKVDLSLLVPSLAGELSLNLKGQGLWGSEVSSGSFDIKGLTLGPLLKTEAQGDLRFRFSEESVGLSTKGNFLPGENDFSVESNFSLVKDDLSIDIKGSFGNLDLLLPWKGAKGKLNYLAEVRGSSSAPQVNGGLDVQGSLLPFPQFAHALTDYSGFVIIKNNKASIRSFKGKLGGGDVQGGGEINLGQGGLENLTFNLEGKNMVLSPFERTRALADTTMRLTKDRRRFILDGTITVHRLLWRREIYEPLAFSSSPYLQTQRGPSFLDSLNLNVHLKADDNAWMENSLGRIRGRFDLTLTGNYKLPILLGDIEALGGTFNFQDRQFQVLRGRVSFFNPSPVLEPYLDLKGETYVKDYRVTFTVTGRADKLKPEFTSSPSLPPEDVLALLSLGEAFRRFYSTETSARTQTSSTSVLSFSLTEQAQRTAQSIFSLDRFRIDPFLSASTAQMTARLTLGKKISKDFFIYYSTNLTGQTEDIARLEWDLSNELSLVGTRNEYRRLSIDFKIRKRF
jgi:hypothetical protein